jgi:hypothetical protein
MKLCHTLTKHLLLLTLAATLVGRCTIGAAEGLPTSAYVADTTSDSTPVIQINPESDLRGFYEMSDVQISVALAVIPDPRIPRHRRAYDNAIAAINQGMLRQNFVLDRFGLPWQIDPKKPSDESLADRDEYGLMLFRRDRWRNNSEAGNTAIALYVVPEAGTYGIQTKAFKKALVQIDSQIENTKMDKNKITAATMDTTPESPGLVVIGPAYSGTIDSIRQIAKSLPAVDYWDFPSEKTQAAGKHVNAKEQERQHKDLKNIQLISLISSSNTVASNGLVVRDKAHITYLSYAASDDEQATLINQLINRLNIPASEVAFLQETSVFGMGFCANMHDVSFNNLCKHAKRINFPANIADVRFGIRQKKAKARAAQKMPFSTENDHLNLEDGAENGSEFPESQQSPLTAVSSQLVLDAALDSLAASNTKLVLVVATDVRDRLFLFEQLRAKLAKALLIDLATDRLLAHPDFLHASRGALSMASAPLQTCHTASDDKPVDCYSTKPDEVGMAISDWSTDDQGLLADIVADLNTKPSNKTAPQPTPHLVTHHGLISYKTIAHREHKATLIFATLLPITIAGVGLGLWTCCRNRRQLQLAQRTIFNNRAACLAIVLPIILAMGASALWGSGSCWLGGFLLMLAGGIFLWQWESLKNSYSPFTSTFVIAGFFALVFIAACIVLLMGSSSPKDTSSVAELMREVNALPTLGMSYYSAILIALFVAVFSLFTQINLSTFISRNSQALATAQSAHVPNPGPTTHDPHFLDPFKQNWPMFILLSALFLTVEGSRVAEKGLKITPFGPLYDGSVWLCVMITLLFSLNMLLNAIGSTRRLLTLGRFIRGYIGGTVGEPLLWIQADQMPAFASTPILTASTLGGSSTPYFEREDKYNTWVNNLTNALNGKAQEHDNKLALYALLASEIFLYQRSVLGVAICSFASASIVYFYPVSDAEILLMTNLGVLLIMGIYSGYTTVRFESDVVLSNVLCNRPSKPDFSIALFGYVAFPFIVLAIVIAITDIPGVMDWGGGLLNTLIRASTPGIFK